MTFNLLRRPYHINRIALIDLITELVDIPVNSKQAIVDDADVGTYAFYFLRIPQRISVIITKGEKNCILCAAFQVIPSHVTCQMFFTPVMVVPFLVGQNDGGNHANYSRCDIDDPEVLSSGRNCPDTVY